ncbi:glucan endo-1,3-alpha-glucosidase agn1 precursor, putative [Talaromyces stipitatus ATCC 10500]|uniref:Glucan endo-1,3-alpha-glucosidase agn1, putative n=1 Tax=Talaromyces stipitatus (strain ATCC 10500 / CBS 375.48 / QM 6759 / NRRL 1006) TaxID=441959 RepID=B8MLF9_TALSN|nr:glucan endo-1,3-alpha-glucosidase agn1 precursor, putative [Talaromyces stipitatus ATCC 10500]EED15492.1 glucan endo-1,3-alpha-glucosidase agn1 precursor, putative [Talaromyces stipitatus ATCC 10500]
MKISNAILLRAAFARQAAAKAVFAHYMVGGITQHHANTDIQGAINVGFDAFALNFMSVESWSTDAISELFTAAKGTDFKLFFSFDMGHFTNPSQFLPILKKYVGHDNYYLYDNKPFVSTFDGGRLTFGSSDPNFEWQSTFKDALSDVGYPNKFFHTFTVVDGAFSWESAWPYEDAGFANVSDKVDSAMIAAAHDVNKYRRGESNLYTRMAQILTLKSDLVEVITWNDPGEGHYIGNFWNESLGNTNIATYAGGFDHTGWQQVILPFITAYKKGASDISEITTSSSVGVIWYRTLLTTTSCKHDFIGLPRSHENAQDTTNYAIILPESGNKYTINVHSDGKLIGTAAGVTGLNSGSVTGLEAGRADTQYVEVIETGSNGTKTTILAATGTKDVVAETSGVCNYNYEVVAMSGSGTVRTASYKSSSALTAAESTLTSTAGTISGSVTASLVADSVHLSTTKIVAMEVFAARKGTSIDTLAGG